MKTEVTEVREEEKVLTSVMMAAGSKENGEQRDRFLHFVSEVPCSKGKLREREKSVHAHPGNVARLFDGKKKKCATRLIANKFREGIKLENE